MNIISFSYVNPQTWIKLSTFAPITVDNFANMRKIQPKRVDNTVNNVDKRLFVRPKQADYVK